MSPVFWAVIGAVLGVGADRIWGRLELKLQERRQRDEMVRLAELHDENRGLIRLHCGAVEIPSAIGIASCSRERTMDESVRVEFERTMRSPRPDPPEWLSIRDEVIPALRAAADNEGRPFTDETAVDLVDVTALPPARIGDPLVYRVGVAETTYYRFAGMSNNLDADLRGIVPNMSEGTLRARWRQFDPRDLADLKELPAPAKIGTVTVVASKPDGILLGLIRGRIFQAGGSAGSDRDKPRALHFAAEGMLPSDRLPDGQISPAATAARAVATEVGLSSDAGVDLEIVPTGLFVDVLRWQPVFCYLALTDAKIDDVVSLISTGVESNEHHGVVPLVWSARDADVQRLLTDRHTDRLASSHAKAALLYALFYKHGVIETAKALRHPAG